jgi:hypothetical protein
MNFPNNIDTHFPPPGPHTMEDVKKWQKKIDDNIMTDQDFKLYAIYGEANVLRKRLKDEIIITICCPHCHQRVDILASYDDAERVLLLKEVKKHE